MSAKPQHPFTSQGGQSVGVHIWQLRQKPNCASHMHLPKALASGRCGNAFQSFLGVITSIYELGDPNYTPCSKIHSMGRKWPLATGGPHCASEQDSCDSRSLARLTSGLVEDSAAQGYGKLEPKSCSLKQLPVHLPRWASFFLCTTALLFKDFIFQIETWDNLAEKNGIKITCPKHTKAALPINFK